MMTFHFKNKEEFYERIADGSLQKSMMEYLDRWADMERPIEEDTLLYNFEAEFECVLENGRRCITDEEVAHRHGEIGKLLHDTIVLAWKDFQKKEIEESLESSFEADFIRQEATTFTLSHVGEEDETLEYVFLKHRLFIFNDDFCTVFSLPQSMRSKDDWTNMTEAEFAGYLTDSPIKSMIWSGDAAHDDIIEHYRQQYRKVDEEGPISLIEYERYLQYAQESSYHEEFLLRIELDEDLPYRHDQNERWLRTECGMRPDPHIARYLEGLHIGYKKLRHAEPDPDEEASHD